MMMGFTVHALYMVVDSIFIGRIGPEALAAATFVGAFFMVSVAVTNGLATGVTATVAQAAGRRDGRGADLVASNGLGLGVALGLVFGVVGIVAGPHLIPLLGAQGETARLAHDYFLPLCVGMPLMFVATSLRAVLNGEGDARAPMVILAASTAVNLGLDPLFIFTFGMGIAGAGWATVAAQLVSLVAFACFVLAHGGSAARFRLSLMAPRRAPARAIVSLGVPAAAVYFVMAAGTLLTNRVIAGFGQLAVAGYGAGSKVDMIVALPIMGLATAAVTLVGMFAGAGRADLVRSTALYTYRWALITAVVLGGAAMLTAPHVLRVFTEDPFALSVGVQYLTFMVFAYPLMAVGMATGRILQGLGQGWPSLAITSLRVLLVGVGGSYAAVYLFDAPIEAVWIAIIAGGLAANALSAYLVRRYLWKRDPCLAAGG
jgi:putative MATE family efflux protein